MEIAKEFEFKIMSTAKKTATGGIVTTIGILIMSMVHGLTPDQNNAGLVVVCATLEALRNILKKKLPKIFGGL